MDKARLHVEALDIAYRLSESYELDQIDDDGQIVSHGRSRVLQIVLPGAGIRIIGRPANPRTARGWTGDVLADEYAMHAHDREIWAAIFPAVTRAGGEIDVASTPAGAHNQFAKLLDNPEFTHDIVTLPDAIGEGLDVDGDAIRRALNDDALWRQEYLCEIVDEVSAFLPYVLIESARGGCPLELTLAAIRGFPGRVALGWDYAIRQDLSVVWALGVQGDSWVTLGLLVMWQETPRVQRELVNTLMECPNVDRIAIDATGPGLAPAEEFLEQWGGFRVEGLQFSNMVKNRIAGLVRHRMQLGELSIPDDDAVAEDLHAVQKEVMAGGNIRLRAVHGKDGHADRFWALALACHAASNVVSGPIECVVGPALATRQRERMF
jgi:phage FluMu gp28-like protein